MNYKARSARRTRQGFTLPEVLVTITLVAILASVVVPTIISQIRKGDPARMGSDFQAIRGASEQFLTDVRKYPASIAQLTSVITAAQTPLSGTSLATYAGPEIARWRGPYLSKDGTAALGTGLGLTMNTAFDTVSLAVSGVASAAGQKYMVLSIPMKNGAATVNDSLSILQLDQQFDDGILLSGNIRYRKMAGGVDTLKFLLMPVY
jgi:prepilin-type N-terminal cleavage/methylation domain-containing protein